MISSYSVLAAGFFKRTEHHGGAAALLNVGHHVLAGDAGRTTAVGALHWEARALGLVMLFKHTGKFRNCLGLFF